MLIKTERPWEIPDTTKVDAPRIRWEIWRVQGRLFFLRLQAAIQVGPYDFPNSWEKNKANNSTASMKGSFDRIICDPPFLNEDCQSKGNKSEFPWSLEHHWLYHYSRTHSPLASQDMGSSSQTHPMYRRAYGESGTQVVWQGWYAHHNVLARTLKGPEQRVQMLRQLRVWCLEVSTRSMMTFDCIAIQDWIMIQKLEF